MDPKVAIALSDGPHLNGGSICLLDDDQSALKGINRLLRSAGWLAKPFDDSRSFLDYAQTYRPDVAVIDILMPGMNGLEVQRRLRNISPSTRVIILTSNDDPVVRSKAIDAGAVAFFVKPVDNDVLLEAIRVNADGT